MKTVTITETATTIPHLPLRDEDDDDFGAMPDDLLEALLGLPARPGTIRPNIAGVRLA